MADTPSDPGRPLTILLLGSGAREHALARALRASPRCGRLLIAPGNPGTAEVGTNVVLDPADHRAVVDLCRVMGVGLVVVGPEGPLVAGIVDDLEAAGVPAFGPGRDAARLEGSKAFTKALCDEAGIPTATYARFTDLDAARAYVRARGAPIVVKADGLAAGKGVTVAGSVGEAEAALEAMFGGAFGAAGAEVVIEDLLVGEEASLFALVDGRRAVLLGSAQDHKRAFDGDLGPNTGGMGAYSPAPVVTPAVERGAMERIVRPAVAAMAARGTPFRGVLFAGLMVTADGPSLIEFNARLGDPEAQVVLPRLTEDLVALLLAARAGTLEDRPLRVADRAALAVVLAAEGYPAAPVTGTPIRGLEAAGRLPGVTVLHAGTALRAAGLVAAGGRVLSVVGEGADVAEARARAYAGVAAVDWPGGFHRTDIGARGLGR